MASSRRRTIHGVLVRVFGKGVLLLGDAGAGKTSCALELMSRGHQFVADDAVELTVFEGRLTGKAPTEFRRTAHVRGSGLIRLDVRLGDSAFIDFCEVDLVLRLKGDDPRIAEPGCENLLGISIPAHDLDAADVISMASEIERIARG